MPEFTEGRHWVLPTLEGQRSLFMCISCWDLEAEQQFDQAFENVSSGAMQKERNG